MAALKRLRFTHIHRSAKGFIHPYHSHHHHLQACHVQKMYFCSNKNEKEDSSVEKKSEEKNNNLFGQLDEVWNRMKEDMQRQHDQHQERLKQHQANSGNPGNRGDDNKYQEWVEKYEALKKENKFSIARLNELEFKAQKDYYFISYFKDPLYRGGMNSWLTGFADRFLYYEEFMYGAVSGLQFICECLSQNDFESVEQCMVSEVYQHVKQLKTSLFGANNEHSLHKLNGYLYNVRIDRDQVDLQQALEMQKDRQNRSQYILSTPVDLYFDVRYYCEFKAKGSDEFQYKIIDCMWHAKYKPMEGERLKYEITDPWTIEHVTISVISHQDE